MESKHHHEKNLEICCCLRHVFSILKGLKTFVHGPVSIANCMEFLRFESHLQPQRGVPFHRVYRKKERR